MFRASVTTRKTWPRLHIRCEFPEVALFKMSTMARLSFVLFCAVCISQFVFAQLPTDTSSNTTLSSLSDSETCDSSPSSTLLSMFSPDSAFSSVVLSAISFVNTSFICTSMQDSQVAMLRSTIKIYLFYGPKNSDYQAENLDNITNLLTGGNWNFSRPATCFFPGWQNNATSENYSLVLVDAYLANNTFNLLVVDWSSINQMAYTTVVSVMHKVAQWLAQAFDDLSKASNGSVTSMVFVGHSLGAHLSGYTSRRLTVLNVTFLAALDPAGPLFSPVPWRCQQGLRANDAQFVMSIHTDSARFGTYVTIGTVDYYPNNGIFIQPGCTAFDMDPTQCTNQFLCSHKRALFFWTDAVRYPGSLIGRLCPSSSAYATGMCNDSDTNDITAPTSTSGEYYFKTNSASPYGQGINGA